MELLLHVVLVTVCKYLFPACSYYRHHGADDDDNNDDDRVVYLVISRDVLR